MKIYTISGLGANEKAFEALRLHKDFEMINLPWSLPEKEESLVHYAGRMSDKININEDFILMGLSFGGIIVQEMNHFLNPKHNILLSTVKNRMELPPIMRFSSLTNAHKVLPFDNNSFLVYSFFRNLYYSKDADKMSHFLDKVFEFRDPQYLKWSVHKIVNWENDNSLNNASHIHGDKDIVFPIKYIHEGVQIIKGGSHIMVMQKPKQVSAQINKILEKI